MHLTNYQDRLLRRQGHERSMSSTWAGPVDVQTFSPTGCPMPGLGPAHVGQRRKRRLTDRQPVSPEGQFQRPLRAPGAGQTTGRLSLPARS